MKNIIEHDIDKCNGQIGLYQLKKVEAIRTKNNYERLVNWLCGEFDLYLKNESEVLTIYFPNGWLNVRSFKDKYENVEIIVAGKSKISCQKIMEKVEHVFNHVIRFSEIKSRHIVSH
ncbi:hypothetical protein Q4566_07305 [Tamlana sp. 2_MG-2023]|uniref:hypothetical protein n=1 Tax=unclassified Tamlana TaxID=2614803 RepID=UPI0026E249F3|nr:MULTISPECIES: hypothetical protein [unclassified Tamlana]MDO6760004.1 hypothetical protein [Tamlana sp. 2_MG-2023]MDO6791826.1 hypothetical protein [Tamlana sp. 1_MG-2023]